MSYTFGQHIEVNQIWGGAGVGQPPYRDWFKGYRFCRDEGIRQSPFASEHTVLVFTKFAGRWIKIRVRGGEVRPLSK